MLRAKASEKEGGGPSRHRRLIRGTKQNRAEGPDQRGVNQGGGALWRKRVAPRPGSTLSNHEGGGSVRWARTAASRLGDLRGREGPPLTKGLTSSAPISLKLKKDKDENRREEISEYYCYHHG